MLSSASGEGRDASLGGRVRALAGGRTVSDHSFESGRSAKHEHPRRVAVHPKGMRDARRHDSGRACFEPEALLAGLNCKPSLEHDVGLVLRMRVQWWGGVMGEEKLDQREAPIAGLTGHLDGGQCAQEPKLLALPCT